MKPKILMIVNEFPPVGESGVQRPLKFLKYLDRAGWETYVVTPRKPVKSVMDPSLVNEVPKKSNIFHTFSLGVGGKSGEQIANLRFNVTTSESPIKHIVSMVLQLLNHALFPLDKQIGWVPFAYLKACILIKQHDIRNVYITAFPYSAFLIGILLKWRFGKRIFWIADYRDTWQFEQLFTGQIPSWRMRLIRKWDERTLKTCDRAVFVTDYIRDRYNKTYPWLQTKSCTITNGYDEDDFTSLTAQSYPKLTMMYMGKFYDLNRPNPMPLFRVLDKWKAFDFQMLHIGSVSQEVRAALSCFTFFKHQGYKPHHQALEWASGADINLLLINDDPDSAGTYSGKLFELLRVGKPILVLGPDNGVAKDLIQRSNAGEYARLCDEEDILAALTKLTRNLDSYHPDKEVILEFSRERLCNKLIELYE